MIPRLGEKYDVDIDTISKPRAEYTDIEYIKLGFPKAPAIMVGDETVVEGAGVSEEKLEAEICKQLNLTPPELKKGTISRFFNK